MSRRIDRISLTLTCSSANSCRSASQMFAIRNVIISLRYLTGVGDSSEVEPTPQDTQVLRGCAFESHCSPPAGPSCHRCAPTCLKTGGDMAAVYGSFALEARYFSVRKHVRQPHDFN